MVLSELDENGRYDLKRDGMKLKVHRNQLQLRQ